VKYCELCQKSGNEVTIVHNNNRYLSLTPGYCLNCQEWVFISFLIVLSGFVTILFGIVSLDIYLLFIGMALLFFAIIFLDIIRGIMKKIGRGKK